MRMPLARSITPRRASAVSSWATFSFRRTASRGGGRRPRSRPGPTPGRSTRRRPRSRARRRARGSRRRRPAAGRSPGRSRTRRPRRSGPARVRRPCGTTTIATSGSSRDDQLGRLADRDRVRRHVVAEPGEHVVSPAAPPRSRRRSEPGGRFPSEFRRPVMSRHGTLVVLRPRNPPRRSAPRDPGASTPRRGKGVETNKYRAGNGQSGAGYPPGADVRAARAREDRRLLERYHPTATRPPARRSSSASCRSRASSRGATSAAASRSRT